MKRNLISVQLLLASLFALQCSGVTGNRIGGPKQPHGSGQVVFIHGMYMTPKCWQEWRGFFEKQGYSTIAPAWPLHNAEPAALRNKHPDAKLAALKLKDVVEHYDRLIRPMRPQPILVGHSMGGLVVQLLLARKLGRAGVAIHSAPPQGVISLRWSFLKSNWGAVSPFADLELPIRLSAEQFHYGWAHTLPRDQADRYYRDLSVPESRRVGKGPTTPAGKIAFEQPRSPLLFVAGGLDRTIPASLNRDNFEAYSSARSRTDYVEFPGRLHLTLAQPGWQKVAAAVVQWLRGT